jgi:hypothetical protein
MSNLTNWLGQLDQFGYDELSYVQVLLGQVRVGNFTLFIEIVGPTALKKNPLKHPKHP